MFDILQAIFWSLAYVLLIVHAIKHKKHGIPLIAICLNFSWETVALIQSIGFGEFSPSLLIHIAWFTLDLLIVAMYLVHESKILQKLQEKIGFISLYFICVIILAFLFQNGGMLLSCFAIDLIMAIAFVFFAFSKEIVYSPLSISIGIAKFVGDLFAWLYYRYNEIVDVIGILVLFCNVFYTLVLIYRYLIFIKNIIRQEDEI